MKKAISLLIAIVMVFSMLPTVAFAVDESAPVIVFETTFTEDMTVGNTFTVTATFTSNPGINSICLPLDWNEDVVSFEGFVTDSGFLDSDVFLRWTPTFNDATAIVTAANATDVTTTGKLFTANFEIVGSGDLGIGFVLENLANTSQQFQMGNFNGDDLTEAAAGNIDYSAIEGLAVASAEDEGATIPDGAPFTAITTDAGAVSGISDQGTVTYTGYSTYENVPYYHVLIPADATEIYVTHPTAEDPMTYQDYTTGDDVAAGYYADTASWSGGGLSFAYEAIDDGYIITIPTVSEMDSDWDGTPDTEVAFVADADGNLQNAAAVERNDYTPICFFTFEYASGSGEEPSETYSITIDPSLVGGTLTAANENGESITEAAAGDVVYVTLTPASGYTSNAYTINGELANDFLFQMPAEDVVLSATFTAVHTCTYEKEVVADKYLKDEATCQSGAVYYKSCECGEFAETAETFVSGDTVTHQYVDGKCKWCQLAEVAGYRFATSADVTAENGGTAVVYVKITGHSDENVTSYNAYDVTLTFDDTKLEYVDYDGAVKSDNGSVTVNGNTIRIVGCGADKNFGTEMAALTFKTKAEGEANVTISKVQVSDKEESVKEDAPEATAMHDEDDTTADETPDVSVIIVPYTVTKPDFISGNDKILHGESYTFSYTDTTNYTYSELTVTVGDVAVENLVADENGLYTITNVNGAIEISATQTPNSYDVTKPENVEGLDKATYGEDYIFTVTPSEDDMAIDTVVVTDADDNLIPYTINENGEYVIEGTDITGAFTITVTEKEKMTTVTFSGIEETEIEGGLTQSAEIGKDFNFQLIREEGYDYTVKVGETELTESEETEGQYTIPAELVVKGGVNVTIEKVDNTKPVVDAVQYISLDGKVMFLVTARWGDKVLAYGEEGTMFWSDKYTVTGEEEAGAYCWLVLSTDEMNTVDLVKAAAETTIVEAAEGVTATAISYDYDVNGTTKVDVNDAQLAYDMYNASYMEFTENLPMLKFLEADMETDGKLDTRDVAAIISYIVGVANA